MKKGRIYLTFIFIILIGAVIIGRLAYLQIIKGEFYKALALGQQNNFLSFKGERGKIFFRGGELLAVNIKTKYIFARPAKIENKKEVAKKISSVLNLEEELVLEKLNKKSLYEEIKSNISEVEAKELRKLNLTGIEVLEKNIRKYPQELMASQVVGFVGGEGKGQYGLEGFYEEVLRGKEFFGDKTKKFQSKSVDGGDIYLTLDYNIQAMAERILEEAKKNLNIEGGQIIVMEPTNGKILALANYPNFNPNNYSKEKNFEIFQNPATQKLFEPGSVFKPITIAGALDQGRITPETSYFDTGKVMIGNWIIYNFGKKSYGQRTMTEVLEKSINTGAVFAERQLGHEHFLGYLERFGFFKKTGIDLADEIFSENKELKKGYEINYSTASFGQGIEITPIQLIRAFSAIANNGRIVRPYLVEKIIENGKTIQIKPEISENQIISSKTASQLIAMLVSVVENGFGKRAKIPGYYVAGKTGTAQIPWSSLGVNKKGYSEKTWQSFIGFAPAFNPKILILVKIDNPAAKTAEYSAVPIFQQIASYSLNYLEIPPDYETP